MPGGSLQFPVSISPGGHFFPALRTLYCINGNPNSLTHKSIVLPLAANSDSTQYWSIPQYDSRGYAIEDYEIHQWGLVSSCTGSASTEQMRSAPLCVSAFQCASLENSDYLPTPSPCLSSKEMDAVITPQL